MDVKQGDLENIILNALWDLERDGREKIFVGDIQEKIKSPQKKWAYTTVKTVLDRLVDKDIAAREKEGKKYLYHSRLKRDQAGLIALKKVFRQYFRNDKAALLSCLNELDTLDKPISMESNREIAREQLQQTIQELGRNS